MDRGFGGGQEDDRTERSGDRTRVEFSYSGSSESLLPLRRGLVLRRFEVSRVQETRPMDLSVSLFAGYGYHQSGHFFRGCFHYLVGHRVMDCRQGAITPGCYACRQQSHEMQGCQFSRS